MERRSPYHTGLVMIHPRLLIPYIGRENGKAGTCRKLTRYPNRR
jgi:hypothetical protein